MTSFSPLAAVSQESIPVNWTSDLAGTVVDPTVAPFPVLCAFPVSSGNALAPAEPSTWYPAGWVAGTTSKGWVSECPVGPSSTGPVLTAGTVYDVWGQVQTGSGNVKKFVGQLSVY